MRRIFAVMVSVFVFCCFFLQSWPAQAEEKEWTYMVFLNADNDLDPFAMEDLFEMAKVGSGKNLNIIALVDRYKGPATLNFISGSIDKIKNMGELDMGDYKVLVSFVKEAVTLFPAKHYVLDIWNHGSGWLKNKNENNLFRGISYDDSSDNHISTPQLGTALAEIKEILGGKLDIFCLDACLMQMMEVAYEIKDNADFMVASEETVPGMGFPYHLMLAKLPQSDSPLDFAKGMVEAYTQYYVSICNASTLSVVATEKLEKLKTAADSFAGIAISKNFSDEFQTALKNVQKFSIKENIDFLHFIKLLKASINDETFLKAADDLETAISDAIQANGVNATGFEGSAGEEWKAQESLADATGLAIYFPANPDSFLSDYSALAFARNSEWDEMIRDYHLKITEKNLLIDLKSGDTSSFIKFMASSEANDLKIFNKIFTSAAFALFCEESIPKTHRSVIWKIMNQARQRLISR